MTDTPPSDGDLGGTDVPAGMAVHHADAEPDTSFWTDRSQIVSDDDPFATALGAAAAVAPVVHQPTAQGPVISRDLILVSVEEALEGAEIMADNVRGFRDLARVITDNILEGINHDN